MDLDPEGIFRDDSDEDDDNVQVHLCFFLIPIFFWLNNAPPVTPFGLWMLGCLLGEAGEGGKQGHGCLPRRRLAQNVHPRYQQGEAPSNLTSWMYLYCCLFLFRNEGLDVFLANNCSTVCSLFVWVS